MPDLGDNAPFALALVLPWVAAVVLTPRVADLARAAGWLDVPDARKRHPRPVPYLGGVALFGAVALGLGLAAPLSGPVAEAWRGSADSPSLFALGAGVLALLALGLWDDLRGLRPGVKLAGQVAVAIATFQLGFQMGPLELPFGFWIQPQDPTLALATSLLLTVAWIVVVTNAFNLIDGLDGLACGLAILSSLTLFLLANAHGATVSIIAALALAGAAAGFLRFNLPPARIFLGDAGAMPLGYVIAVTSMVSSQKGPTAVALTVPLLILGVPLLDTLVAVVRRARGHLRGAARDVRPVALVRALFAADRGHVHHLLVRAGWGVPRVLGALYGASAALAALGMLTRGAPAWLRWSLWLGLLALGYAAMRALERRVARREPDTAAAAEAASPPVAELPPRSAAR